MNTELPESIIEIIISKVTNVNCSVLRLVCKEWNDIVISKFFPNTFLVCTRQLRVPRPLGARMEYDFSMRCIEFDQKYRQGMKTVASFRFGSSDCPVAVIANSCQGLLCMVNGSRCFNTYISILNPMTSECMNLPGYEQECYWYGFGFSPNLKQYKVARISESNVEIFILGKSSEWRQVDYLPFHVEKDGVYFDGGLYWIGTSGKKKRLCRLDIEHEKFDIIDVPKLVDSVTIGVFNGSLYASIMEIEQPFKIEVWMMQSYGEENSGWTLGFVIDRSKTFENSMTFEIPWKDVVQLIKSYDNEEILCLFDQTYLFSYNIRTGRTKSWFEHTGECFWVYPIESVNFDRFNNIFVNCS